MAKAIRKFQTQKSTKSKSAARRVRKAGAHTARTRTVASRKRSSAATKPAPVQAARRSQQVETAAAVAEQPARRKTWLSKAELEHFRELLLAKRRELLGDMRSWETEALQRDGSQNLSNLPIHMADQGTDNYEQEFTLGLMEKDRQLLKEIDAALVKIRDGTYGICEGTGQPISKPRLEAQPWARYSIEYARKLEQGRVRP